MDIRYLRHEAIDKQRWDAALAQCAHGNIYATSLYLNHMSPGWDALVLGDYEALFPLPWRSKWGTRYICQPFLTAQLGLFELNPVPGRLPVFLQSIPEHFRLIDLPLNEGNLTDAVALPLRSNYRLLLDRPYGEVQKSYRENIRRNIRKAFERGCRAGQGTPLSEIIALARSHAHDEQGLTAFEALHAALELKGQAKRYGIRGHDGQLLASAVFLMDAHTAYYILVGNHPNGRTLGASHLLIDSFIRDHAGSGLTLDFEGSDMRNLAFFYSSFGATLHPYPQLHVNRLPWWIRWIKN
ncbi:MAG: GNAT family N-acetyltransferase [Chitinophagaceae bacterium]|nr:MAG: GNAT family N-acetyltransferase [Chitinophagaceae bacterium]